MKKFTLLFVLTLAISVVFAQEAKVRSALNYLNDPSGLKLDQAKATIDEAKAWTLSKETQQKKAVDSLKKVLETLNALPADNKDKAKSIKKNEKAGKNAIEDLADLSYYWYVRGQIYQSIAENPIPKLKDLDAKAVFVAYEAYNKALEVGANAPKGYKYKDETISKMMALSTDLNNKAIEEYQNKNYEVSYNAFESAMAINDMPEIRKTDTMFIYYTGLIAYEAKKYDKAIEYFDRAIKLNYGKNQPKKDEQGNVLKNSAGAIEHNSEQAALVFLNKAQAYQGKGTVADTAKSIEILKEGIKAYPEDNISLMLELTNYYLKNNLSKDAMTYLDEAIKKDNKNISLYHAKGTLYDKMKDMDNAIVWYKKALEIKADYFDSNYNAGALYYNKAAKIIEESATIPLKETERYNAEIAKANEQFKLALPFMEKANVADPNDITTLQTLLTIYHKLDNKAKKQEIQAKIDAIKNK